MYVHIHTCTQVLIHTCTCFAYLCTHTHITNTCSYNHYKNWIVDIQYMYTHIHISELEILTAHQIIMLSLIQYQSS